MWPFKSRIVNTDPAPKEDPAERIANTGIMSTHDDDFLKSVPAWQDRINEFKKLAPHRKLTAEALAADSCDGAGIDAGYGGGYDSQQPNISDALASWYNAQTFIGTQLAGIIAQHWLIYKACAMPGRDAIRHGFTITTADGDALAPETLKALKAADKRYKLNKNLAEFITKGRMFGVRICIFKVDYGGGEADADAYAKPFNIDGVRKGSYRGMVQVDPYWCTPELDGPSSAQPDTMHFYEPTWWIINGRKYHRSHLVLFRNADVMDVLKPSYLYGGIPVPQLIMERVYGAERTANEAPLLALTKRTTVYKTDLAQFLANFQKGAAKLLQWSRFWNNNGIRVIGEGDEVTQIDTSLTDLDQVIASQYTLVAAAADVPVTKLMGTQPKGLGATGEYDESSYHETLESLQTHDLTPLVERHHSLVLASLGVADTMTTISWEPLDSPTAKEYAEINKIKSETDKNLIESQAINGVDIRNRIANDKNSDYADIEAGTDIPEDNNGPAGAGSAPPQPTATTATPVPPPTPAHVAPGPVNSANQTSPT